jgi:hypothetical protein
MSAFRGMYSMFRADLLLFRFLEFPSPSNHPFETREKLSHTRGMQYIYST